MRTQIFEPLGMRDTTIDVATEAIPARATFYWPLFGLAADTRYGPKPSRGTTYLMTFPERGLVVAVMANISFADTKSIALNIAQAFAEQGRSPARQ
jgi:CubicO group peptidase (beta-lactamase class C family)